MPAVNPQGSQKYWFNGLPFVGVAKSTPVDEGTQKYWLEGLAGESLYPNALAGGDEGALWYMPIEVS